MKIYRINTLEVFSEILKVNDGEPELFTTIPADMWKLLVDWIFEYPYELLCPVMTLDSIILTMESFARYFVA